MERAKNRIAIIGSGISGLVAAYEVNKYIQKEQLPFEFLVLEERLSPGGTIKTVETEDGYVDVGASSFDLRHSDVRPFIEELGLSDELQYSIGEKMDRFSGHEFIHTEKPTYHGIPMQLKDIMHDKELSLKDKLTVIVNSSFNNMRRGADLCISTANFLEYRFCKEVSDLIAYPNYPENIYGSIEVSPPEFFDTNLITLFEYTDSKMKLDPEKIDFYTDGSGKEYTFKKGMSTLVKRLLRDVEGFIQTDKKLEKITQIDKGNHLLTLNKQEELRVGCVISTLPLSENYDLFSEQIDDQLLIPKPISASMGTVFFQFPKGVIGRYPVGHGFVIPKRSEFQIAKATFLNRKWPSFENAKYDNIVVDIGRRQEDTIIELPDEVILEFLEKELQEIINLKASYHYARVYRWPDVIPHMSVDDRQRLIKNRETYNQLFADKGLFIGGNGLRGYGLRNAIGEGKRLAAQAIAYMKDKNATAF